MQLDPHLHEPFELHPQSEPGILICGLIGCLFEKVVFVKLCEVIVLRLRVDVDDTHQHTKKSSLYTPTLRDLCGNHHPSALRTSPAALPRVVGRATNRLFAWRYDAFCLRVVGRSRS